MNRRSLLRLLGNTLFLATWAPLPNLQKWFFQDQSKSTRLFFEPPDLERIQGNSKTPLLQGYWQECLQADIKDDLQFLIKAARSRDLIKDLAKLQEILRRESLVFLITADDNRKKLVLTALDSATKLPNWDYFIEGGKDTIGLQRAPETAIAVLFAMEALGQNLDEKKRQALLKDVAEKGCLPSYRSLWGMRNKEQVKGWGFNPAYLVNYEIDFRRWPWILDRTNLKAIPISGLGIGALALTGHDDRAEEWLDMAESSAKDYLTLFKLDGSYFEGVGYADYSLRNLFTFFEAHRRIRGTIDWFDMANFYGVTEYLVCMQAGVEGEAKHPDIVNFSDARISFFPSTALWIANRGDDPLAQYAAVNFSDRKVFTDFLWYDPARAMQPPAETLANKRFDLDWIVCRTGWQPGDNVLAFRGGMPSNHEHADRNSIIFKAYGERLLTDPFNAAYDWRDPAWLLRQTEAHNAVLIDGKGHQYHDGHQGTNASQAEAHVVRFVDRGDVVWWCSDATQAYRLVDANIVFVMRSVLFVKPEVVIVFDQVKKRSQPSTMSVRFQPDNRDGKGLVEIPAGQDSGFTITRPAAQLFGMTKSNMPSTLAKNTLALPPEKGIFPYVESLTEKGQNLEHVSALIVQSRSAAVPAPAIAISHEHGGWLVKLTRGTAKITVVGDMPELSWQA